MATTLEIFLAEQTHLSPDEQNRILKSFKKLDLKKNEYFVRKGDVCKHIAFVEKGVLRFINETDDEDITMLFIFENSFTVSLTSLVYKVPSIWSIRAVTDCELMVIERDVHFSLINEIKPWLELDNIQLLKAYTELENRVFTQFHLSAEERFNKLFAERPELFNLVPLKHIASMLGITPETLSRLRRLHLN
jgi:CRP/FNR family transcriptional regulator, anaerobic regulatory protein